MKTFHAVAALILAAALLSAHAEPGDSASKAFQEYKAAAERGDANAQFNLGLCYDKGKGVAKNSAEAVKWYSKAAAQGHTDAKLNLDKSDYAVGIEFQKNKATAERGDADDQYKVGLCYAEGKGVEKDLLEARIWYGKAAAQGHADAQYKFANTYYYGLGVKQDYAKAVEWNLKAAEQGHAIGQYNLGLCYADGNGVEKNLVEAYAWINLSSVTGEDFAESRDKLEKMMSPQKLADAQKRSKELSEKIEAKQANRRTVMYRQNLKAAQLKSVTLYPDVGIAGSPLNTEFVARMKRYQAEKKEFFAEPDWPIRLVKECNEDLSPKQPPKPLTARVAEKPQKIVAEQKLLEAAAIVQPEERKAFDDLYFGDSEELTQYKLAHSTKLKGKTTKRANDTEAAFYALNVDGRSYAVQTEFEGGKLYEVSFVQTFGDISTHFEWHNLMWGVFSGDISQYHSAIKESWQVLRDIAITRFGQPTKSIGYPNFLNIEKSRIIFSDIWEVEKRRVTLGMVQAIDDVGPILSVSDAEVNKKLNGIEDAKRKEAVKAAAGGF